ncbi:MAG: phosphoribosylformylglycinamidine synthase [Candidatus Doudnabacteria bacterium CG10_big_fil_rev_8_21_14_0_10_42_18]|uniref:Phosphoribosylformylglycinamidine synthase n=1 Tax=Candidatus Doudnabacteria bacterium CG10_big_fil_rev_8_21_14_0_10_42_18 TaxID=1974552 RepID=A0A2H0VBX6_9BACT|nr:MAG: phosphoribosylformylglycinamidine synthase [Candidatus Doudnabacteria bacterium CG10_big_fil_rev_8_21_14_0_10_42_18]
MKNTKPKILVLSGYGLNCEDETAHAFELGGGVCDIVHINDLINDKKRLPRYQILAIPGGFSFGDDTGSGKAYANKLKNHFKEQLLDFAEKDKLIIGICNGFQILTQTGLLPGALTYNDTPRYNTRWVDLRMPKVLFAKPGQRAPLASNPWLVGIEALSLPIAHGEGKFYADKKTLNRLQKNKQIAYTYVKGEISTSQKLAHNPNGSALDIAGILGYNGRVLGTMPHPERAVYFTQHPLWTLKKEILKRETKPLPKFGPSLQIFKNAINYFK